MPYIEEGQTITVAKRKMINMMIYKNLLENSRLSNKTPLNWGGLMVLWKGKQFLFH
jgi:hypothetical protein